MIFSELPQSTQRVRSSAPIPCFEPATGVELGNVQQDDEKSAAEAVERARAAHHRFRGASLRQRKALLRAILKAVVREQKTLCDWSQRDSGKTQRAVWEQELWPLCQQLTASASELFDQLGAKQEQRRGLFSAGVRRQLRPRGVVGLIVSSHEPLRNVILPVALALAAGNAVVVKVGAGAAWSSEPIVQTLREVLRRQGHDPELIQLLFGLAPTSRALLQSGLDCAVFIGNRRSARRVRQVAATHDVALIECVDPCTSRVILAGADLRAAAKMAVAAAFFQRGQLPGASERVLVERSVAAEWEQQVVAVAREQLALSACNAPMEVGAVATRRQLLTVETMLDEARSEGARVLLGGERRGPHAGTHWAPTVVTDLGAAMALMQHPTRSPTLAICPVDDALAAAAIIDRCQLGDSVAVHAARGHDLRALSQQLHASRCTFFRGSSGWWSKRWPASERLWSPLQAVPGGMRVKDFCRVQHRVTPGLVQSPLGPKGAVRELPLAGLPAWLQLLAAPSLLGRLQGAVDLAWALGVGLFALPAKAPAGHGASPDSRPPRSLDYDGGS